MAFFTDEDFYSGPPLTEAAIDRAEQALGGYKLPSSYIEILREKNGGEPQRGRFDTEFEAGGSRYFVVRYVMGIGAYGFYAIDDPDSTNTYFLREWGFPEIGVSFCATDDDGHDAILFDYRACGKRGEPAVAYIDEDRVPRIVASDFADFISQLKEDRRD